MFAGYTHNCGCNYMVKALTMIWVFFSFIPVKILLAKFSHSRYGTIFAKDKI